MAFSAFRFGYATDETPELMPKTIMLAHQLNAAMAAARRDGSMGWLRPDSKTQVTIEYKKDTDGAVIPLRVDTIVISTQHAEEITTEDLRKQIKEGIIKKVISADLLDERTVYHVSFRAGVGWAPVVVWTRTLTVPFSELCDLIRSNLPADSLSEDLREMLV
jgi:S-adenosylmethionine synthetase